MTRIRTIYGKIIAPKIIEDSLAIVCYDANPLRFVGDHSRNL